LLVTSPQQKQNMLLTLSPSPNLSSFGPSNGVANDSHWTLESRLSSTMIDRKKKPPIIVVCISLLSSKLNDYIDNRQSCNTTPSLAALEISYLVSIGFYWTSPTAISWVASFRVWDL